MENVRIDKEKDIVLRNKAGL